MKYSKIAIAQSRPTRGHIDTNIKNHIAQIQRAASLGADLIAFPELSLTGYEPTQCQQLAVQLDDTRLRPLQAISNSQGTTIIAGAPLKTDSGIQICSLIFRPNKAIKTYAKQYLHEDELPFFIQGKNTDNIIGQNPKIALAICYELSVLSHHHKAVNDGADIYLACVAKSEDGVNRSEEILSAQAIKNNMPCIMINSVGKCEDCICAGSSAVWNKKGELLAKLDNEKMGLIMYDTNTDSTIIF